MASFSLRHVFSASLHYPMSIMAFDSLCPRVILPMRLTLFPSGVLCVTNIPSNSGNDTFYCSELSEEHAGESFRSLRLIVLRYANVKLKNCRFSKNLAFDLS